jgi:hypothetical protein
MLEEDLNLVGSSDIVSCVVPTISKDHNAFKSMDCLTL